MRLAADIFIHVIAIHVIASLILTPIVHLQALPNDVTLDTSFLCTLSRIGEYETMGVRASKEWKNIPFQVGGMAHETQ